MSNLLCRLEMFTPVSAETDVYNLQWTLAISAVLYTVCVWWDWWCVCKFSLMCTYNTWKFSYLCNQKSTVLVEVDWDTTVTKSKTFVWGQTTNLNEKMSCVCHHSVDFVVQFLFIFLVMFCFPSHFVRFTFFYPFTFAQVRIKWYQDSVMEEMWNQ